MLEGETVMWGDIPAKVVYDDGQYVKIRPKGGSARWVPTAEVRLMGGD